MNVTKDTDFDKWENANEAVSKRTLLRHSTVPAIFDFMTGINAGTWNRRNKSKNNGSMSFHSFVVSGRWNVVFALTEGF